MVGVLEVVCDWKEDPFWSGKGDIRGIPLIANKESLSMKCMECGKEVELRWKEDGENLRCPRKG